MKKVNGWHLPTADGYFARFTGDIEAPSKGTPSKSNGFQKDHLALAMKHVKNFDVAVDVGAHVGFWTHDMAARFSHVFAFEPAADTFQCLTLNMAEHGNVMLVNAAIGNRSGRCKIMEDKTPGREGNTGARFVLPGHETEILRLDDLNFHTCDLLKIDVEGFEAAVIEGARAMIKAFQPVIIMETDKRFPGRYAYGKFESRRAVLELGYTEIEHLEEDPHRRGHMRNAIRPDRIFVPHD